MAILLKLVRGLAFLYVTIGVVLLFFALLWRQLGQVVAAFIIILVAYLWWKGIGAWIGSRSDEANAAGESAG